MTKSHEYILEINDLTKVYDNQFEALKGVSFNVSKGDFFALLGPNGAGKSTIIGIINSLVKKTSGTVKIFGYDIDTHFTQAKFHIGIVPQEFNFGQFKTVFQIVTTQAGYYGVPQNIAKERAEKYLKKMSLWDKRDTKAYKISGGMKRRLMIARALMHEPDLLILDEPTAGVDIEIRHSMWTLLQELNQQGTTIILTTHYLEEAELLCKNIGIIDNGKVIKFTDKKTLLSELNKEKLLIDIIPNKNIHNISELQITIIDEATIEITWSKNEPMNHLFKILSNHDIQVLSLRNKTNRLETLFLSVIEENK